MLPIKGRDRKLWKALMCSRIWHFPGRITFYQATENVYTTLLTPSLWETPSVCCRYTEDMPHMDSSDNINYRSIKWDMQSLQEKRALWGLKVQICSSPLFLWDPSIQLRGHQHREHIGLLGWVQQRVKRLIKGMRKGWKDLGLFSLEDKRPWSDIILASQYLKGHDKKDGERLFTRDSQDKGEWFQTDREWV